MRSIGTETVGQMNTFRITYRRYHVYLVHKTSGWSYLAEPSSVELPILRRSSFSHFASIESAQEDARNRVYRPVDAGSAVTVRWNPRRPLVRPRVEGRGDVIVVTASDTHYAVYRKLTNTSQCLGPGRKSGRA
jgi:hypothetical protein